MWCCHCTWSLKPALSNAGVPLDFSLCLYGPPGTGKSALARAVADRLAQPEGAWQPFERQGLLRGLLYPNPAR